MPLTFRKSFQILPGVRLNINRRSWSVTTGGPERPEAHAQQHRAAHHVHEPAGPVRLAEDDQAHPSQLSHPFGPAPRAGPPDTPEPADRRLFTARHVTVTRTHPLARSSSHI